MPRPLLPALLALTSVGACASPPVHDGTEPRVERVVSGLRRAVLVKGEPEPRYRLVDRLAHYRTPAITVAVADSGRIVWARAWGLKEAGTADSVTPETPFLAGSISKPVAATVMLRLVEQGRLSLDEDVNRYLKRWKVPDSRFTVREKVTLRRLVSHSAGLTVHGFPGYKVTDSIPTVPQILDGTKPANTAAVRVDTTPGAIWRYSGGGTTVMQLLLEDVTGRPFAALARELVLDPAGMTRSTYEQSNPPRPGTAAAHKQDGAMVPGRTHLYPEMAAAGLWTTPTDLLRWAIAIAESRAGKPNSLLSQEIATEMLTVQKGPTGLGPFLRGDGKAASFGHGGADEGFHAQLIYFPETGQGAAVMVNGDGGPPAMQEVLYAIAAEYGWPAYGPEEIEPLPVDSARLAAVVGTYAATAPFPLTVTISREGGRLFMESEFNARGEAVFTAPDRLKLLERGFDLALETDGTGRVVAVSVPPFRAVRRP